MNQARLADSISGLVGDQLAEELAGHFVKIRQDVATSTLERASPGKFVETFVQCLQQISTEAFVSSPSVDHYLNNQAQHETELPESLRVAGARIARSMYTLRNKRSIAHNGEVDPNRYDLAYLHQSASWIMAEMVRCSTGVTMEEAGRLIELIHAPVGTLVEEIDGVRLVHANVSQRVEIVLLLHSHYPDRVGFGDICATFNGKRKASIKTRLSELRTKKFLVGNDEDGYRLTSPGFECAVAEINKLTAGTS